jgi:hypothetical protein
MVIDGGIATSVATSDLLAICWRFLALPGASARSLEKQRDRLKSSAIA